MLGDQMKKDLTNFVIAKNMMTGALIKLDIMKKKEKSLNDLAEIKKIDDYTKQNGGIYENSEK